MTTNDPLAESYDVIVIGGGIGGLTAANRIARFGRKVLLLEQHFELGGLAAYFRRGRYIYDTALHGFPVGMIKTCRKYWSKEMAEHIVKLDSVRFDNPQYSLDTDFSEASFRQCLLDHFNIDAETVERFFTTCREMDFYDNQTKTTRELFEEFFPGRTDVMRFLMEPITYANGSNLDEPAITYGIVFSNFMSKGIYFFQGGTDKFVELCRKELLKNGATIMTSTRADTIELENGTVCGVRVGERLIRTKAVISNGNLKETLLRLIGTEHLPATFAAEAEALRLSTSISQVYLGIKEGIELPFIGDVIFHSTASEFSPAGYCAHPPQSRSFSIYYPKSRPPYTRCGIVASMGAHYDDWKDLTPEAYKAAKQELIEQVLSILEENYLPNIREIADLEYAEAATPVTFERYTLHPGGATFGTKFEGLKASETLPKTVPGAFHTGSAAIIMSGWLGAANYGVIVANNCEEYLDRTD